MLRRFWFGAILFLGTASLALGACTPGKPSAAVDTGLYAVKSAYAVAQKGAIAYAKIPRCSNAVELACSEQDVVDDLVRLDDKAVDVLKQTTVTLDMLSIMLEFSSAVTKAQLEAGT